MKMLTRRYERACLCPFVPGPDYLQSTEFWNIAMESERLPAMIPRQGGIGLNW